MNEPILHHYPASPYAEKIRLLLGFKGLAWRSVTIPAILPKPDLMALTGGYRRTPVLQLGADIYCDSTLIVRALEALKPSPTLYPFGDTLAVLALGHFAESVLFNVAVPIAFQPEALGIFFPGVDSAFMDKFRADRAEMRKGGTVRRGTLAECKAVYAHLLPRLEAQFIDGRAFAFGGAPSAADFALYHTVWAIGRVPSLVPLHAPYPKLVAWMARMAAIGHGRHHPMSSGEAIRVAQGSKPAAIRNPQALETEGLALGDEVEVLPVDYALDAVRGRLLEASAERLSVLRMDDRAGKVAVHFPRMGFQLRRPG